ncbi:hypothetical protein AB0I76_23655, partial [Micromonospora sp. NPDC049799]
MKLPDTVGTPPSTRPARYFPGLDGKATDGRTHAQPKRGVTMRKQMEGDNQRRRALAREARERGMQASETGASLSASKQLTHLDKGRRIGPAPAGQRRKPDATRGGPA